jgi:prophage antirepressor-like protein
MRVIEVEYKGKKINVESLNENPLSEKDIRISGALIPALELEGGTIETQTDENGVVWFKANDVCKALEYNTDNIDKTLKKHVTIGDRSQRATLTKGGKQKVNFINESGLYSLILSSQLPKAKEFRRWVTSEVLPKIARTGRYESKEQEPLVIRDIDDFLAKRHKTIQTTNKEVRAQIGKPVEGERMERSAINISKITNALAFGKHYNCQMRQILTKPESEYLHTVLTVFETVQRSNPHLELVQIKEKVAAVLPPRFISKEEIERRLSQKAALASTGKSVGVTATVDLCGEGNVREKDNQKSKTGTGKVRGK